MTRRGGRRVPQAVAVCLALVAAGCLSYAPKPAFDPRFADNRPADLAAVFAAWEGEARDPAAPWLVATVSTPRAAVVAFDLGPSPGAAPRPRWTVSAKALTRPEVLGDLVVFEVAQARGREVLAVDARTGRRRWAVAESRGVFLGAARTGGTVALVWSDAHTGGTRPASSRVVGVDAASGSVRWEHGAYGHVGAPEARGRWLILPWDRQNLAILDGITGTERARLRAKDDVIGWVTATNRGVFYGSENAYALGPRSAAGTRAQLPHLVVPMDDAPGLPALDLDDFTPKSGARSARGRIRLLADLETSQNGDSVRLRNGRLYFVYYRYIFASRDGESLDWVRALPRPLVGAEVTDAGLLLADDGGGTRLLDARTGADAWVRALGPGFDTAVFAGDLAAVRGGDAPELRDTPELRKALMELALDPDNTLAPGRAYAVQWLGQLPEASITRDLVDLYAQGSLPPAVRRAVENAASKRTAGLEHITDTLTRRYDFLAGTEAPPFRLLLPALVHGQRKDAVADLVRHLFDHETPARDLPDLVRAIVALGDASALPALREFVTRYRADSSFARDPSALVEASLGVEQWGGTDGRATVDGWAAQAGTLEGLRAAIVERRQREAAHEKALAAAEEAAKRAAAEEAARHAARALPTLLTQSEINAAFAPHVEPLRVCILDELARTPTLARVRVTFIIEGGSGTARDAAYAPATLAFRDCLAPLVAALRFPPFRAKRQAAQFTVSLETSADAEAAAEASQVAAAERPWWERDRSLFFRPDTFVGDAAAPWWTTKQLPKAQPEPTEDEPAMFEWWIPVEEAQAPSAAPSPSPAPATAPQAPAN